MNNVKVFLPFCSEQIEKIARAKMSPVGFSAKCRSAKTSKRNFSTCAISICRKIITERKSANDFPEWRDAIIRADGLVIVTPEYNHGYPGILKSVFGFAFERIHSQSRRLGRRFRRTVGRNARHRSVCADGQRIGFSRDVFRSEFSAGAE